MWPDKKGGSRRDLLCGRYFVFGYAKHYASGNTSRYMGTLAANPYGKYCVDEKLPEWGKAYQQCFFWFTEDSEIYDSATDSGRDSFVRRKVFKR